jgi:hypothetical protein
VTALAVPHKCTAAAVCVSAAITLSLALLAQQQQQYTIPLLAPIPAYLYLIHLHRVHTALQHHNTPTNTTPIILAALLFNTAIDVAVNLLNTHNTWITTYLITLLAAETILYAIHIKLAKQYAPAFFYTTDVTIQLISSLACAIALILVKVDVIHTQIEEQLIGWIILARSGIYIMFGGVLPILYTLFKIGLLVPHQGWCLNLKKFKARREYKALTSSVDCLSSLKSLLEDISGMKAFRSYLISQSVAEFLICW